MSTAIELTDLRKNFGPPQPNTILGARLGGHKLCGARGGVPNMRVPTRSGTPAAAVRTKTSCGPGALMSTSSMVRG